VTVQPFIGFAPDADPATPGVITSCEMMEPIARGMRGAPSAATTDLPALAAASRGAALVTKLDGSKRLIAGTQTKLYEASAGAWTDRSQLGDYTGSAESRWAFAQFGDVTLAQNGIDRGQASSSGAFADLTAMPIASLMESVSGFVMCANIGDSAYQYADAWWCSALYDHTDWTPAIATQSARGRLLDAPGPITALQAFGNDLVVAFKRDAMYVGRYVGPDVIWAWEKLPGSVGAFSAQGVVSDGSALYWWGGDDFYRFDGSRPQPIGSAVREWFAARFSLSYASTMLGSFDPKRSLIRWYYASGSDASPSSCIVLNTATGKWGVADRAVEAVVEYVSAGITYDSPGILAGVTFDSTAFPQSYDSPFWIAAAESPSIIDTTHTLKTLTGISESSSLTTGDIGDDDAATLLRRVRPRYSQAPTTASMTHYTRANSGESLTQRATITAHDGKFDVLHSARWHRAKFDFTGDVEVSGINADLQPDGQR